MPVRPLSVVVLAAGEGTRMRSTRPKPLHQLCGRSMVMYVLDAVASMPLQRTVLVVGHAADRVTKAVQEEAPEQLKVDFVEQRVQRGTGDAVSVALTAFPDELDPDEDDDVLVLPGDTPLLRAATLERLVEHHRETDAAATLLTAVVPDPSGYGRILRDRDDRVRSVVEHGDATEEEREIDEICTSIYCFRRNLLAPALRRLSPENVQGEYYLTDVVSVLHDAGHLVTSLIVNDAMEAAGVNDRAQLAEAEAELRDRINHRWMTRGVTMLDPYQVSVDAAVELGTDVTLLPGTLLQGKTRIGSGSEIGPHTHLIDTTVGERAIVQQTSATEAEIGAGSHVGPFSVLRPGCRIAPETTTGPFFTGLPDGS